MAGTRAFNATEPPRFPGSATEYVRGRFTPKGRPYHYSAPAGLVRAGDVVAVPCNWVSPEGTLADVVEVLAEPPEIPGVDTFAAIWRVIPPDQLPLFRPGQYS